MKNMNSYTSTRFEEKFESGLTWRSFLAALYTVCIFTPAVIWAQLVTTGANLLAAIQVSVILIFVEFARYSGKPLTMQEATIIYLVSSLATALPFTEKIYRLYFVHSPIAQRFGLTFEIPTWYAPAYGSPVWWLRTFWHTDWLVPIGLWIITQCLGTIGAFAFAAIAREIFIEAERLPFPIQQASAQLIITLTERSEERLSILSGAAFIAAIYGILLYTIPTIAQAAGYPIRFIPIPWVDYTIYLESAMPGASFGIATDIMLIAQGLILPTGISAMMIAGSIIRFIIVNWLTVHLGVGIWASHYTPGMDITRIFQESTLYLWINPIIGMGFAVGLIPLIFHLRRVIDAFKVLGGRVKPSGERISGRLFPPKLLLTMIIIVGFAFIVMYNRLVPEFPLWALITWEYPLMFVLMLITVRVLGETGITWEVPYIRQLLILASGYRGIDGWFLPLNLHPGTAWTANFKICRLTKTDIISWIKAYFVVFPISILMGIIYVNTFWAVAPIPSAIYPMPAITWPVQAMFEVLWITRPEQYFRPDLIVYSFMGMSIFGSIVYLTKLPISITGLFMGITTPIPFIFTIFLGTIIGKVIAWRIGRDVYDNIKMILAAGLMLGEGLAIIIGVAGALIQTAIWARPY